MDYYGYLQYNPYSSGYTGYYGYDGYNGMAWNYAYNYPDTDGWFLGEDLSFRSFPHFFPPYFSNNLFRDAQYSLHHCVSLVYVFYFMLDFLEIEYTDSYKDTWYTVFYNCSIKQEK